MSSCNPKGNRGEKKYLVTPVKAQPAAEKLAQGISYDMELKHWLRQGDVFSFRNFLARSGRALPDEMMLDTLKMQTVMHQLILTMPDLEDLHAQSKAWLDNNTFVNTQGLTLAQAAQRTPEEKKRDFEAEAANSNQSNEANPVSPSRRRTIHLRLN